MTINERQNANASQNKKICNQPHKPTQVVAHLILPNCTHLTPDKCTLGNLSATFDDKTVLIISFTTNKKTTDTNK
jgi:hypothetical protein